MTRKFLHVLATSLFMFFIPLFSQDFGVPGAIKWKTGDIGLPGGGCPALGVNMVYVTNDQYLYAIRSNGKIVWKFPLKSRTMCSPVLDTEHGTLYVGTQGGTFFAISTRGELKWTYQTNGAISSSPAYYNSTIYFGCADGYLYALNIDGTLKWKFQTLDAIISSPCVLEIAGPGSGVKTTILFGSNDGYLYALNDKGNLIWRFRTNGEVISSPAVSWIGDIFFGSTDQYFYHLDADGTLISKVKTRGAIVSSPVVAGEVVYFASEDRNLYAYAYCEGKILWKFKTGGPIASDPLLISADSKLNIIVLSKDGFMYVIDERGNLVWKKQIEKAPLDCPPTVDNNGIVYFVGNLAIYAVRSNSKGLYHSVWPKFRRDEQNRGSYSTWIGE